MTEDVFVTVLLAIAGFVDAAIGTGDPGIYNIVDDEPAPVREWLPALAAEPPRRIPAWIARIAVGEHLVAMMTESRAGSNAKARQALGWRPAYASWRQGFPAVIASGD
jgi:2-alkyl-3-oxoalkanoate reductase